MSEANDERVAVIEPIDVLQALLFASEAPVEAGTIQEVLELESADAARALVASLRERLEGQGPLQVIEVGGGFRLVTRPEVAPWLVKLARSKTKSRLSRPALETLAIIAYRQPVSRPEVDATRGVNSEGVLDNLLERRLVRIAGRKDSPGRPFLYETTREFLVAFGLRDLGDLPKVDGELVVVDPSAATASEQEAPPAADAEPEPTDSEPEPDAGAAETAVAAAVASAVPDQEVAPTAEAPDVHAGDPALPAADAPDVEATVAAAVASGMASAPAVDESGTGEREDAAAGGDSPQQDPGAGGADVAPRR